MLSANWENKEDLILMKEYLTHGRKWTKIKEKLKERNVYQIQNRFSQLIKFYELGSNKEIGKCFTKIIEQANQKFLDDSTENSKVYENFNEFKEEECVIKCPQKSFSPAFYYRNGNFNEPNTKFEVKNDGEIINPIVINPSISNKLIFIPTNRVTIYFPAQTHIQNNHFLCRNLSYL